LKGDAMKKTLIPMMILALSGAAGFNALADTVTSVNAVGMVKVEIPSGQFTLMSLPFVVGDEGVSAEALFGVVPYGTTIYYWQSNSWVTETYTQGSVLIGSQDEWSPEFGKESRKFQRGDGIFVYLPANQETLTVVISGEVPDNNTAQLTTKELSQGFSLIGFGYPVELSISDERIDIQPSYGDSIYVWNNGWQESMYQQGSPLIGSEDGWEFDLEITPGGALFYRTSNAKSLSIEKDLLYSFP